jgi:hypothetical protein
MNLPDSDKRFQQNWEKYWSFMSTSSPELSKLALFVLSILTQTATVERLFKDFSMFHTKVKWQSFQNLF